MDNSLIISIISIAIATLSAIFTGVALWKNNFSKFKPITLVGDLNLRIYPIKSDDEKWFIPSLDVPINIANEAARPGKILRVRIVVNFPRALFIRIEPLLLPQEVDSHNEGTTREHQSP